MTKSESIGKLAEALAKAQSAFLPIEKSKNARVKMKSGGEYEFDYADLHSVIAAVTPALSANGLALIQDAEAAPGSGVKVSTMLLHASGEWIQSAAVSVPIEGTRPQEVGGAISYARRYALSSLLSVASTEEDDDGNAAEGNTAKITDKKHAPPGDVALKFRRGKGENLSDQGDEDLRWYIAAWERELADPEKAKFHASCRANLAAAQAMLASRASGHTATPAAAPAHVKAAWEKALRGFGGIADATDPWRVAVRAVVGARHPNTMTEKEALSVEALIAEHVAARESAT